jgi:DNA-binding FadR family transcriptional regulator
MATLEEQFEQAEKIARQRRQAPSHAQASASFERLDALHDAATRGEPADREAAMREYIELVGDLGQQGG